MESLRAYELELAPAVGSVELQALRSNSEADAERLRNSVPRLVAGIIAEVRVDRSVGDDLDIQRDQPVVPAPWSGSGLLARRAPDEA